MDKLQVISAYESGLSLVKCAAIFGVSKQRIDQIVHWEKSNCRQKVNYAIEHEKIRRQPCQKCGEPNADAHHEDYSKPLEIIWLCKRHHKEIHVGQEYQTDVHVASMAALTHIRTTNKGKTWKCRSKHRRTMAEIYVEAQSE